MDAVVYFTNDFMVWHGTFSSSDNLLGFDTGCRVFYALNKVCNNFWFFFCQTKAKNTSRSYEEGDFVGELENLSLDITIQTGREGRVALVSADSTKGYFEFLNQTHCKPQMVPPPKTNGRLW